MLTELDVVLQLVFIGAVTMSLLAWFDSNIKFDWI
jgi:hypothetical protein